MSTTYTSKDYRSRWYSTFDNNTGQPIISNFDQAINSMFLYEVEGGGLARVKSFKLPNNELVEILNSNGNTSNNQMRLHLAANPAIPYGHVTSTPAFTLIVDAYNSSGVDHAFSNLVTDYKIMQPVLPPDVIEEGPSGNVPPGGISLADANVMDSAFRNDFPPLVPPSAFTAAFMGTDPSNNRHQFVSGFTVGSEDVELILNHLDHGDQSDLYIHLGYLPTDYHLPNGDWFRFRCVLQINSSVAQNPENSFYYEFSKPCPPACGDGFVDEPLTNPIDN